MNLELIRFGDLDFSQELDNVVPLVSLELNHFSILRMLDNSSVTGKFLLACLDNFLLVIGIGNALNSSQRLPTTPLLDTDVDETVLLTFIVPLICIKKWVWR